MRALSLFMVILVMLAPGCINLDGNDVDDGMSEEQVSEPEVIEGCTDSNATNHDPNATKDDGSCEYEEEEPEPILGCTDSDAENYDSNATEDDGTCEYLETIPCNGLVILCHRTYDDVTFPETHNAFSTHEDNIYLSLIHI